MQGPAAVLPRHPVPLGPQSRGRPLPAPRNRKSKCLFVGLAPKCSGRPAQGPLHGGRTCCFSVILSFGTSVSLAQCPEETAAKAKDGRAATSAGAEASAGVREQGGAPGGSKGARKCRGDRALGGGGSAGGGAGERGEGRPVPGPGGALRPVMPPGTSERAGWPPAPPWLARVLVPPALRGCARRAGSLSRTLRPQASDPCAHAGWDGSLSDSRKPFSRPRSFPRRGFAVLCTSRQPAGGRGPLDTGTALSNCTSSFV